MINNKGFTLMEVLVAVVILGVSLSLIVSLFGGGLRLVKSTENYSRALVLAREKLSERLSLKGESSLDESPGRAGGYEWGFSVLPLEVSEASEEEGSSGLYRIEVRVTWKEGARVKEVSLYGLSQAG